MTLDNEWDREVEKAVDNVASQMEANNPGMREHRELLEQQEIINEAREAFDQKARLLCQWWDQYRMEDSLRGVHLDLLEAYRAMRKVEDPS